MSRLRPITLDILDSKTLKELYPFYVELEGLLSKSLNVDKRVLRQDFDKELYKTKLNLYSRLYRQIRDKLVVLTKKEGKSSLYKVPPTFDEYILKWKKEKYINYSGSEDDDEIDSLNEITELIDTCSDNQQMDNELYKQINKIYTKIMANKYFNRTDPNTIESAVKDTIIEFLEKHKGQTNEEVLQRAYHEIKNRNSAKVDPKKAVAERVGEDKTNEPLAAQSPVTGNTEETVEKLLEVVAKPIETEEPILQAIPQEEIEEMLQDEHSHPGGTMVEEAPVEAVTAIPGTNFKTLPLETKLSIIKEVKARLGDVKTGPIKKDLETQGYIVGHYDDVYNLLSKIK